MRLLIPTFLILVTATLGFAQASRPTSQPTSRPVEPKRSPMPPLGHPSGTFGAGVDLTKATPLAAVAKRVKELHGRPVRVDGLLKDVCRKKGCWVVLRDGKSEVRVKFRDYAFFVPRDASGRRAIVQGIVTEKTISEAEAKHYAEEGGDPAAAKTIKGPQKVLAFMATGVEILGKTQLPPRADAAGEAAIAKLEALIKAGKVLPQRRTRPLREVPEKGNVRGIPGEHLAHMLLRSLKGPRTVEFSLYTELKSGTSTWYVFSSTKRGFGAGFAVRKDGAVKSF
jgi:hypothetical protein